MLEKGMSLTLRCWRCFVINVMYPDVELSCVQQTFRRKCKSGCNWSVHPQQDIEAARSPPGMGP